MPASTAANAPAPKFRLQAPDDSEGNNPRRLSLPPPEQLGIPPLAAKLSRPDWNGVRDRLDRLGASGFHVDKLPGGYRVRILMPAGQGQQSRLIETQAETEADAINLALENMLKEKGGNLRP